MVPKAMMQHATPVATYRLQFNREFTFRQAAELVPYLASLGISHCYASPYLRARPGSTHGYDIIDHNALNPEIGNAEDYEFFVAELHRHNMGQILDLVPNHMGVMGSDNAWWLDVLENGEASPYADFFDIDWCPIKDELRGKVLIPILEDQYGQMLERGELKLSADLEHGAFSLFYQEHRFPIDPREYPRILGFHGEKLLEESGKNSQDYLELQSIITAFQHLPDRRESDPEKKAERNREREVQKRRLAALCARSAEIAEFIAENIRILNGMPGEPSSFDALHELIKAQAYRLTQWRVASDDINYRRFFDVNDLAALRMENDNVFDATHGFILNLVAQGKVNGLRIDHPDGLYDPRRYLRKLQDNLKASLSLDETPAQPAYIVVEKILANGEQLPRDWPVSGTTGYDFANLVNGLFVDGASASRMERLYRTFTGDQREFAHTVYNCKKLILKASLASELNVLANLLSRIALSDRHTCDFTLNSLRSALAETIASFPVYRTYVTSCQVSQEDRLFIEEAIAAGRKRSSAVDTSVFDFIRQMLLLDEDKRAPEAYRRAVARFAMKFQQLTSAVMAKGVEDTAFYRYHRLISLNEVGGDPARYGTTVEEFHAANQTRTQLWPQSMLATSTHDSKRSEDARARIDVLSEIPGLWRLTLRRWRDWNRGKKRVIEGMAAPARSDEYLLYQTLIGVWPATPPDRDGWSEFCTRIEQYMLKAVREAKQYTSWANHSLGYEAALTEFVRSVLKRKGKNRFLSDFGEFHRQVSRFGVLNALAQTLLKLTSPGVPDTYQGNELWDFSLVDPDNRRRVDYVRRRQLFDKMQKDWSGPASQRAACLRGLLDQPEDGRIKLFLIWRTLCARQHHVELFRQGAYLPLTASGAQAAHVCAFARRHNSESAIVIVPRLCAGLLGQQSGQPIGVEAWGDTNIDLPNKIADGAYRNVLTGESISIERAGHGSVLNVSSLLNLFPVGFFVAQRPE